MKVLLIGADTATKQVATLSAYLHHPDATVLASTTATGGLELVGQEEPDMVLMSTRFPDMSLAQAIQELRRISNVPLMVLGHQDDREQLIAALELGADDFAYLPCTLPELSARFWAVLRRTGSGTFPN